jgi:ornithine decarboxylase
MNHMPSAISVTDFHRSELKNTPLTALSNSPLLGHYSPAGNFSSSHISHQLVASFSSLTRSPRIPLPQDAFFVVDLDRIREKYRLWQKCFPNVQPHYAVKANPNPDVLALMAKELNINFDCASQSEIEAVLAAGVDPSRIIFANPCKNLAHSDFARRVGVLRTTFDSEAELYKIKAVHPKAHLLLRIWVDDKDAQCQLSNKYGAHLEECPDLFDIAKELGLEIHGVSFHAGSGASSSAYLSALKDARAVFQMGLAKGFPMRVLDIGGGFPGTEEEHHSLDKISKLITPYLKTDWSGVELISEPGRFFCSEAQTLATQVIGKRVRKAKDKNPKKPDVHREYTINDGVYQSFNCMLYDHSVLLKEDTDPESKTHKYPSTLFGQTCDGLDTISGDILLPELGVGDWLVVPNMGAYTNGASSQFNGFSLNGTVVLPPPERVPF